MGSAISGQLEMSKVLGYSLSASMETDIVLTALKAAIAARKGQVEGVVFHVDYAEVFI